MLENIGINVNQLKKLEIKPIVVVVGLLVLLKLFLIDGVLLVVKKTKQECQLNNYWHVVIIVVMDVVEVGIILLGTILNMKVLFLVIYMTKMNTVNLIHLLLVIIMLKVNSVLVLLLNKPLNVLMNVTVILKDLLLQIDIIQVVLVLLLKM